MKFNDFFKSFLQDTVNLNETRITSLEKSVDAIKKFIRQSEYEPGFIEFQNQGSWAHGTIIKPLQGEEFDADLLLVVNPVSGWTASDYIVELGKIFKESPIYKEKVKVYDYCITIKYEGDKRIDVAPLVKDRGGITRYEVCNRPNDTYCLSEPIEYTEWINERNRYSGLNSFKKVTRILKYLRDIKGTFTCPSVLLTTLIGYQINWHDQGSDQFCDTPTTLKTIIGKLDDWLQSRPTKPMVVNPKLAGEDFAEQLTQDQYINLRRVLNRYRGWIDDAYDESDRQESIRKWRRVLGEEFAKGQILVKASTEAASTYRKLLEAAAHYSSDIVEHFHRFGTAILPSTFYTPPHLKRPPWRTEGHVASNISIEAFWHPERDRGGRKIMDGERLPANGGIWLEAKIDYGEEISKQFRVQWRVTNTGQIASRANALRGDFYPSSNGFRRWESLSYRGVHFVEAFVLKRDGDVLVAQSRPFHVVVE